jgi:hypothetical protein
MKNLIFAGLFVGFMLIADFIQLHGYSKWAGVAYLIVGAIVFANYIIGKVRNRG